MQKEIRHNIWCVELALLLTLVSIVAFVFAHTFGQSLVEALNTITSALKILPNK